MLRWDSQKLSTHCVCAIIGWLNHLSPSHLKVPSKALILLKCFIRFRPFFGGILRLTNVIIIQVHKGNCCASQTCFGMILFQMFATQKETGSFQLSDENFSTRWFFDLSFHFMKYILLSTAFSLPNNYHNVELCCTYHFV